MPTKHIEFNLELFKALNDEYKDKSIVPAPRPPELNYRQNIGRKRGEMLDKKIGIRGLEVLEIGCGVGAMCDVLAADFDCTTTGVDVVEYAEWQEKQSNQASFLIHDVTTQSNEKLGPFDRVISFAVFEHIVHPHAALSAAYDVLKPGGKAYIYANLYRGTKASHRYREVFFPWAHLLFQNSVWRHFYRDLTGEENQPAWVNKLTYDQYVNYAERIGFQVDQHFPSPAFFDQAFYDRFETELCAYPKFDLMHDFIHLILTKPDETAEIKDNAKPTKVAIQSKIKAPIMKAPLVDIKALRNALTNVPPRAYERISHMSDNIVDGCIASIKAGQAYTILGNEFEVQPDSSITFNKLDRSGEMYVAAWDHLEPLFVSWSENNNKQSFDVIKTVLLDQNNKQGQPIVKKSARVEGVSEEFGLYDTAIGTRFHRLAYFLHATADVAEISDDEYSGLFTTFMEHLDLLADDEKISWRHNHGIFQVLCALCGVSRFLDLDLKDDRKFGSTIQQAFKNNLDRLSKLLDLHFCESGFHREHSPYYHAVLANAFDNIASHEAIDQSDIKSTINRIRDAAQNLFDAEGRLVPFGDSDLDCKLRYDNELDSSSKTLLIEDAGYWFVRAQGDENTTFLAQSCAFHSRVHKQADSGTVVWQDRGKDILIDAGRYGYRKRTPVESPLFKDGFWYADPKRVHVESTRAHNTIEIDGKNHRRFRQPVLGGGITSEASDGDIVASRCVIANAARMQHQRFVVLYPSKWMVFVDTCRFPDGPHDVRQWFHLHPDWKKTSNAKSLMYQNDGEQLGLYPMLGSSIAEGPYRGQKVDPTNDTDPGLRGWWSPKPWTLKPCASVPIYQRGEFVSVATLISLDPVDANMIISNMNATQRAFSFQWQNDKFRSVLKIKSGGFKSTDFDIAFTKSNV